MGDTKLFQISPFVSELKPSSLGVEKDLQTQIENNLETFLGVTFLASEFSTGKVHGGRIDTIGIDENWNPVIVEYKRSVNDNVINQGLFYLDWMLDHRAELTLLVQERLGSEASKKVDWTMPRLLCIAGDFTKYDVYAVKQILRPIELIRYQKYGDTHMSLELINVPNTALPKPTSSNNVQSGASQSKSTEKTVTETIAAASPDVQQLFETMNDYLLSLGEDVTRKDLKNYVAFRRFRNFACLEVSAFLGRILCFVKTDFEKFEPEEKFTRDVRNIGHYGTGDVEITIMNEDDFERAKELILISYDLC